MAKTSPVSVRLSPELLEEIEGRYNSLPISWRGSKSGNTLRVALYGLTISEVSSAAFALA